MVQKRTAAESRTLLASRLLFSKGLSIPTLRRLLFAFQSHRYVVESVDFI